MDTLQLVLPPNLQPDCEYWGRFVKTHVIKKALTLVVVDKSATQYCAADKFIRYIRYNPLPRANF